MDTTVRAGYDIRGTRQARHLSPAAMQRDERRKVAAAEARAIKDDPADLAEIREIQQDMAALHEG